MLGYGVTGGAVRNAVSRSRAAGSPLSGAIVQSLWPIPETALGAAMGGIERIVVPELNMGLYKREIERIAGGRKVIGVNGIDGDLITLQEIADTFQ